MLAALPYSRCRLTSEHFLGKHLAINLYNYTIILPSSSPPGSNPLYLQTSSSFSLSSLSPFANCYILPRQREPTHPTDTPFISSADRRVLLHITSQCLLLCRSRRLARYRRCLLPANSRDRRSVSSRGEKIHRIRSLASRGGRVPRRVAYARHLVPLDLDIQLPHPPSLLLARQQSKLNLPQSRIGRSSSLPQQSGKYWPDIGIMS